MQNYLPPKYLIEALKTGFEDDQLEKIRDFDAQVEFWDYSQILDQKKNSESTGSWHIQKK